MSSPMTFVYVAAQRRLKRIVQLLEQAPEGMTRDQLASAANLSASAMSRYLDHLRGTDTAPRLIRIGRWIRQLDRQGNFTPIYFAGTEPDEPRPPALSNAERVRRYRVKRKTEKQGSEA